MQDAEAQPEEHGNVKRKKSFVRRGFTSSQTQLAQIKSSQSIHAAMSSIPRQVSSRFASYSQFPDEEKPQMSRLGSYSVVGQDFEGITHRNSSAGFASVRSSQSMHRIGSTRTVGRDGRVAQQGSEGEAAEGEKTKDEVDSKEQMPRFDALSAEEKEEIVNFAKMSAKVDVGHERTIQSLLKPLECSSCQVVFAWCLVVLGVVFGLISLAMAIIFDTALADQVNF